MALTDKEIDAASREIFGKAASKKVIETFQSAKSVEDLKRTFASTAYAQDRKGFDPSKYGASKISYVEDPTALGEDQKAIYDAWVSVKGKNAKMTHQDLETWTKWGSPERLKAEVGGLTRSLGKTNDGREITLFTPEAIKAMGGSFVQSKADRAGSVVLVPKGTANVGLWKSQGSAAAWGKDYENYDIMVRGAKERSGLVGKHVKALTGNSSWANQADRIAGVAGSIQGGFLLGDEAAAIGGGTRGAKARVGMFRRMGMSEGTLRTVDQIGDITTSIAAGAADITLGGAPVFSTANTLANAGEAEMLGQDAKWGQVAATLAIDWVTFGVTKKISAAYQEANAPATAAKYSNTFRRGVAAAIILTPLASTAGKAAVTGENVPEAVAKQFVWGWLPGDAATQGGAAALWEYSKSKDALRAIAAGSSAATQAAISGRTAADWAGQTEAKVSVYRQVFSGKPNGGR